MCWLWACPHAGVEKLIIAHTNQETGLGKGWGRPKAPTKLDPGKSDTRASTKGAQQPLAFYKETAGIKGVILVDWSITQYLPVDRRVMGLVAIQYNRCKSSRHTFVRPVNTQFRCFVESAALLEAYWSVHNSESLSRIQQCVRLSLLLSTCIFLAALNVCLDELLPLELMCSA